VPASVITAPNFPLMLFLAPADQPIARRVPFLLAVLA